MWKLVKLEKIFFYLTSFTLRKFSSNSVWNLSRLMIKVLFLLVVLDPESWNFSWLLQYWAVDLEQRKETKWNLSRIGKLWYPLLCSFDHQRQVFCLEKGKLDKRLSLYPFLRFSWCFLVEGITFRFTCCEWNQYQNSVNLKILWSGLSEHISLVCLS